jgi:hypothetical protein
VASQVPKGRLPLPNLEVNKKSTTKQENILNLLKVQKHYVSDKNIFFFYASANKSEAHFILKLVLIANNL